MISAYSACQQPKSAQPVPFAALFGQGTVFITVIPAAGPGAATHPNPESPLPQRRRGRPHAGCAPAGLAAWHTPLQHALREPRIGPVAG